MTQKAICGKETMPELNIIDLVDSNAWESGADGYILKAGQGQLEYNWRPFANRAEQEGKPWGLYWVPDPRYSPESQKAAIKAAFPDGRFGVLGLWLDVEKPRLDMTDAAYRATPYPYYKPIKSIWDGIAAYCGVHAGWYFSPGSWDLILSGMPKTVQDEISAKSDLWIAHHYATVPTMRGSWVSWSLWQWRGEPDYNHVNLDWWERVTTNLPPAPVVYHIKRPRSEVDLCITPGGDTYPLKPILQHAAENGWTAAINCGAGFDYTDATHAKMRTADFQSIPVSNGKVYYARRAVTAGVVNDALDTSYKAPWTLLGFDANTVHLIVTKGQEGGEGMTQMQAAQWAQARGIVDCYLMDSGHSSGIVENGALLYSGYNEPIPQCLGLKTKITGGTMIKGTCKAGAVANIKDFATGLLMHQMVGGESVYGEWSSAHTDIVNFSHYYTSGGSKISLAATCKVSVGSNLTITENATEPGDTPPPPPSDGAVTGTISLNVNGVVYEGPVSLPKK
jgi:hypothetical protein